MANKVRTVVSRFWQFLAPRFKPSFRFVGVSTILAAGWYAFLSLVSQPPIDATPVLIMIWSSVLVLLFALFPKILDRVKRFKLKDFEIELQDTVARSTPEDYIHFPIWMNTRFHRREISGTLKTFLNKQSDNPQSQFCS